jgi:FtsP/CotA-like multicopper oxidase with cupredoxin domain
MLQTPQKNRSLLEKAERWSRRNFLKLLIAEVAVVGAAAVTYKLRHKIVPIVKKPFESVKEHQHDSGIPTVVSGLNPMAALRDFDYGTVKQENGRTVREFKIEARTTKIQLNNNVSYDSWTFNGKVPGPTLRATEGDRVRVIYPGQYMFHPHQDAIAQSGCMGAFKVVSKPL